MKEMNYLLLSMVNIILLSNKSKNYPAFIKYIPFTINFELFWDSIKGIAIFNGQINISKSSS